MTNQLLAAPIHHDTLPPENEMNDDSANFTEILNEFKGEVRFAEALILTSLPRGGLQIVQPAEISESLLRNYSRNFQSQDRLTWQAIARGEAIRARNAWPVGEFEASEYYRELMQPSGLMYAAAAPLAAPVLDGYPGAVHIYRRAEDGAFTDDELRQLMAFAKELDQTIARTRSARLNSSCANEPGKNWPAVHQFIFDATLRSPLPQTDTSALDAQLRQNILQDARKRLAHVNGEAILSDRVPLPDSRGDLWNFRVAIHRSYPALGDGPVAFFSLEPSCSDWSTLRPADFQADNEIARLIPAMKFMREEFHRGPTLVEIAKTVRLSPFHFHRRFTELLGITPKHFLLDCQIQQAKKDLLDRKKDLATISKECGFAHQSHFTSRFKQASGLTPTRWRRMASETKRDS